MKVPRVADFDPQAAVKPLASPLDDLPRIEKPSAHTTEHRKAERNVGRSDGSAPEGSRSEQEGTLPVPLVPPVPLVRDVRPVPLVPPKKRPIKQRQPFDIYYDQMEALRGLA